MKLHVKYFPGLKIVKQHSAISFLLFKESCKCLGGNLLELETSDENEFIKNDLKTLNTEGNFFLLLVRINNSMMSIKKDTNIKELNGQHTDFTNIHMCILYEYL